MRNRANGPKFLRIALLSACVIAVAAVAAQPATAALSGEQQQALERAKSAVGSAEADLKSAAGSAGTAARPAKGSRLKLTRMRLNSAVERLNQVAGILNDLPGDDDAVKAVLDRHAAAATEVRRIEVILAGGASPDAGDGTSPAPGGTDSGSTPPATPSAPKLDYRQEKSLKDARWYINEMEQCCAAANGIVNRLDGEGEQAVHADVKAALNTVAKGWQRHGYIMDGISKLPQDHPRVSPLVEQAGTLKGTLGAIESRLKAADVALEKLTGMANYPAYDQDFRKIQAFSRRYSSFETLVQSPEKLAAVIREDASLMGEVQRLARLYLPLVEQKTDAGAKMDRLFAALQNGRRGFAQKLRPYGEQLPKRIDGHIGEAVKIADEAVAGGHPHWFGEGSGIDQELGYAEQSIAVLEVLNEKQGKQYRQKLEKIRVEMDRKAESLREQIIENNPLPPDNYTGKDRNELVEIATAAWRKVENGAKILGARIPRQTWKRVTEWRAQNRTFYKVDSSRLQVQLLVDAGDGLAVIRPVNLYKNHLAGDAITASPMDAADDKPRPQRILKADKIK